MKYRDEDEIITLKWIIGKCVRIRMVIFCTSGFEVDVFYQKMKQFSHPPHLKNLTEFVLHKIFYRLNIIQVHVYSIDFILKFILNSGVSHREQRCGTGCTLP